MTPPRRAKQPRSPKDAEIKARIGKSMLHELDEAARDRVESRSLIIRDALSAYLNGMRSKHR
jgi:metal-responsive CopG/Arc/MetJ family transcriptional regulator